MKQIVTLSGKGGTGKTTVLGSFAALAGDTVLADCDVDAANLYLLLHPQPERTEEYQGARIAVRDAARCAQCGECERRCRFDAITVEAVSASACEGCGLCVLTCPREALALQTVVNGILYEGMTTYRPLKGGVIRQFIADVEWGPLDYLVVDLPPGTGDEPLTVGQMFPDADGGVIVTTPQEASLSVCRKAINFLHALKLPVLGVIENMSGFVCPHCGQRTDVLMSGGGEDMAARMGCPSWAACHWPLRSRLWAIRAGRCSGRGRRRRCGWRSVRPWTSCCVASSSVSLQRRRQSEGSIGSVRGDAIRAGLVCRGH